MKAASSPLIDALVARLEPLPPSQWAAVLADATSDPEVRAAVRARLTTDEDDSPTGELLGSVIGGVAALWADHEAAAVAVSLIGQRLGPYEITGTIGQGGMGTVYRARRADGQFDQDVAIKVVRHGFETPMALERFRQERQLLAGLAHSSIARLLDGGTMTGEGAAAVPYLVMEFVDGQPITTYCQARQLTVSERVRLFRRVCGAVQHAHQQFIVHRDLKPANILITRDGEPKLLDFGIATLATTEDDGRSATSTGLHLLTPDYASPEQVRAEPVTAGTDVYSLGAILYELLTGKKAHQFESSSPVEIGRVICDTVAVRPSDAVVASPVRRELIGDLDTIVLKALCKEPARRYASVEQFSEDLRRHLAGLPVLARPDTVTYRAGKFMQRHRLMVAASILLAASLVAGAAVSLWQARRAERRFEQVRTLANSLIYDVHDAVRDLPGSTRARQTIVATGLDYLNRLEGEAAGDAALQRDLAAAYLRIGDVQGGVLGSNLGDVAGALTSYQRARDLTERIGETDGPRRLAAVDVKIGDGLSYHGDLAGALQAYSRGRRIIEPVASSAAAHPDDILQLAAVLQGISRVQGLQREMTSALETSQRLLELRQGLVQRDPANTAWRESLAGAEAEVSMSLQRMGRPADALPHARSALAVRERQAAEQTGTVGAQRSLILAYSHVADVLGNPTMPSLGDSAGAIELYRKMTSVAERLLAADASDRRAKLDMANCLLRLGSALVASPDRHEGIARLQQSEQLMRDIVAAEPKNNRVKVTLAFVHGRLGDALDSSGRSAEAIEQFDQAIRVSMDVLAADPKEGSIVATLAVAHDGKALVLAKQGRRGAAIKEGERAIELLEGARRSQPGNTRTLVSAAAAYSAMGRVYLALGSRDEALACPWFAKSLDAYAGAERTGPLDMQAAASRQLVVSEASGCPAGK
jgi:tetratricopeptide (TPR) repeat protein